MPREKKITIFFLVLGVVVLGIIGYFLSNWYFKQPSAPISPMPTHPAGKEEPSISENFEKAIEQLNTSQKLIDYLNENFIIEDREQTEPFLPREFFEKKKGTSWDFAVFTSYVLWKNNYDASIVRYKYDGKINAVVVFRDKDLPKTIIFTKKGTSIYPHGWSFEEMFQEEEQRLGIKITEHAISYWTDKGELWPEKWEKRNQ
ncbi:hypothetical protein J7L09_01840 [bacterium]|nr:hypothetical protein [bacterium]